MMKKVVFSLDMLKKIVSGEVKGKYVIEGCTCVDITFKECSPWIVVWLKRPAIPCIYKSNGESEITDFPPLELYIEEPEPELKPFDKAIAKRYTSDCESSGWEAVFYSHKSGERYVASSNVYDDIHLWRDCYARYLGTDTPWDQIVEETEGK